MKQITNIRCVDSLSFNFQSKVSWFEPHYPRFIRRNPLARGSQPWQLSNAMHKIESLQVALTKASKEKKAKHVDLNQYKLESSSH